MTEDATPPESDRGGLDPATQRRVVRERYARIASSSSASTEGSGEASCCGDGSADDATCCGDGAADAGSGVQSTRLGYADEDVDAAAGADLGLGCGNPTAIASLEDGETVLDLGSGAGFDCFLAAREVGESGKVVGVDMTPEMVEKARENVAENDATNVEFRLGEIEHLPVADGSVDVIISNCVINLSPDEQQVFAEAFRVLRPGGRLTVSDVVLTAAPPANLRADPDSVAACVAGASPVPALERMLRSAGFADVAIEPKADTEAVVSEWDDEYDPSDFVVSATIEGRKPATGGETSGR